MRTLIFRIDDKMKPMAKRYQVSDGKMVLTLQPDEDGWFTVTSPTDPAMITQARTIDEAFKLARDAFAVLAHSSSGKDGGLKSTQRRMRVSPLLTVRR